MNILVVSQYFYPENFRINDVAAALAEQGHRVKVLTGLPDYASSKVPREYRFFRRRRESWNGVEIVRVPTLSRRPGDALPGAQLCLFRRFRDAVCPDVPVPRGSGAVLPDLAGAAGAPRLVA